MKTYLVILLLLAAIGVAGVVSPAAHAPVTAGKVEGRVYAIPGDFLVQLRSGHVAFVGVALVLGPEDDLGADSIDTGDSRVSLPAGKAAQRREDTVRAVVGGVLQRQTLGRLRSRSLRRGVERQIDRALTAKVDVDVRDVMLTDVAVR